MESKFKEGDIVVHKIALDKGMVVMWGDYVDCECRYFNRVTGSFESCIFAVDELLHPEEDES